MRLTDAQVRQAKILGRGNMGEGIRKAIQLAIAAMGEFDAQVNEQGVLIDPIYQALTNTTEK